MSDEELSSISKYKLLNEIKRRINTGDIKMEEVTALIGESRPAVAETLAPAPAPATTDEGSASSAGAEPAPDTSHSALSAVPEAITSPEAIMAELERLSGGRFLSIGRMNEALKKLKINVEIPADEIERLNALFPKQLTPEAVAGIKKLKDATEDGKAPLIMQIPQKVLVDGAEKPFTIETLQDIMLKAHQAGFVKKPLWLSDYVTEETKSGVWDSGLRVWTSACLAGSKDQKSTDQFALQERILGKGSEIHADMIIAMCLHYILSGEELMRNDFMRLNDLDAGVSPLSVDSDDDALNLRRSRGYAYSYSGVGASSGISS